MINIKVCKLSDLIYKAVAILLVCVIIKLFFDMLFYFSAGKSAQFVKKAIQKNLCLHSAENLVQGSLYSYLPVLEEEEIWLAENQEKNQLTGNITSEIADSQKDLEKATQKPEKIEEPKWQNPKVVGKIPKITAPYLLAYNKVTNSKFKIGSVTVNDYTKGKANSEELEKALFSTKLQSDCKVLIYHTHTSESYYGTEQGDFRTSDESQNVVKVGEALKEALNTYGIYVRHDTTVHDYPSYNGAYKSSLNTVENILKNENYDIIIDIHRDAISSNSFYRPTAEINGETVAKLMFVVGTNVAGLKHDHWMQNLSFAVTMQERANEIYEGLFRDMHLSTSRYNQHTCDKAIILEVGATRKYDSRSLCLYEIFCSVD